jgi:hypothetical protein
MMDNSIDAKIDYIKEFQAPPPKYVIRLTEQHIECGERKNPDRCPLALAFRDAGFTNARVLDNRLEYFNVRLNRRAGMLIGGLIVEELKAYDEGRFDFIPYTYWLRETTDSPDELRTHVAQLGDDEGRRAA